MHIVTGESTSIDDHRFQVMRSGVGHATSQNMKKSASSSLVFIYPGFPFTVPLELVSTVE